MIQHLANWTLSAKNTAIGDINNLMAQVPGCVHTDLLAHKLIPDPYLDLNENDLQWIGRTDWTYACEFEADQVLLSHEKLELVCEGLDTIASIVLNGQEVAKTQNMHRAYHFDIKPFVHAGQNSLEISFAAPMTYGENLRDSLGGLPNAYAGMPFNFMRKMASNFGWDWGPILTTSGIWQPIYVEAWNTARITSVRPLVFLNEDLDKARIEVHLGLDKASNKDIAVLVEIAGQEAKVSTRETSVVLTLELDKPELWWPVGHGRQPLYDLKVKLLQQGQLLEEKHKRIGIRKTELDTSIDAIGSAFAIKINNKPILIKGANWIPDDCFPSRITKERYQERIQQALDANMNMLRVWGGGIYEQHAFYDFCDEKGVLVWQDFLFACAAYPEEEPFWSEVEAEARYQVTRLSSHPSLVLWNGNNENIEGYFDWGWRDQLNERTWGQGYYLDLLPSIVSELDPTRPYWPGSPYSGTMEIHPLADNHGTKHIWDAWNRKDYLTYRAYVPRFVAEFGHQAPPTYATLEQSLSECPFTPDSPGMLHHQKAMDGNQKLHDRLKEYFPVPEDFDDWHYAMQLNQARAIEYGVTYWRSFYPICTGTLYWQINDCWPVTSWAAIDGYGRKKPFYYATKGFYADRLLTIQPRGDRLFLFACNDSDSIWEDSLELSRQDFLGKVYAKTTTNFTVQPRSTQSIFELPRSLTQTSDPSRELIKVNTKDQKALWFFERDKNLAYPQAEFEARLEAKRLTITAKTLVRDICIFVDRLHPDATISDQLITLLPGEAFTFEIQGLDSLGLEQLIKKPVFQCANHLI